MKHDVHVKEVRANSHANLVLLHRVYTLMEQRQWWKARNSFLTEELEKHGKLECYYCHREDLVIENGTGGKQATVDHKKPISSGGKEFDKENFAVCCHSCNSKKGSTDLDTFVNGKYLKNKEKIYRSAKKNREERKDSC